MEAHFGSLDPTLPRMTQESLGASIAMAQDNRPEEKAYRISTAGREALVAALMVPPAPDKMRSDYLFMLLLGHTLPPSHLRKLVDRRIAWYRDSVAHMENCDLSASPPSVQLVNGQIGRAHV